MRRACALPPDACMRLRSFRVFRVSSAQACESALYLHSMEDARAAVQEGPRREPREDPADWARVIKATARLAAAHERALNLNSALRRYRCLAMHPDAREVREGGQTME